MFDWLTDNWEYGIPVYGQAKASWDAGMAGYNYANENTELGKVTGYSAQRDASRRAQQAADFAAAQQAHEAELAQQNMQFGASQLHGILDPWVQAGLADANHYRQLADNPDFGRLGRLHEEQSADLAAKLAGMGVHNSSFNARGQALLNSDYLSQARAQQLAAYQPLLGLGSAASNSLAQGLGGIYGHGFDQASAARSNAARYQAEGMSTPQPDPYAFFRQIAPAAIAAFAGPGAGLAAAGGMQVAQGGRLPAWQGPLGDPTESTRAAAISLQQQQQLGQGLQLQPPIGYSQASAGPAGYQGYSGDFQLQKGWGY